MLSQAQQAKKSRPENNDFDSISFLTLFCGFLFHSLSGDFLLHKFKYDNKLKYNQHLSTLFHNYGKKINVKCIFYFCRLHFAIPNRELAVWILFSIQGSFALFWFVVLLLGNPFLNSSINLNVLF
jgi:hypothetical protein